MKIKTGKLCVGCGKRVPIEIEAQRDKPLPSWVFMHLWLCDSCRNEMLDKLYSQVDNQLELACHE